MIDKIKKLIKMLINDSIDEKDDIEFNGSHRAFTTDDDITYQFISS